MFLGGVSAALTALYVVPALRYLIGRRAEGGTDELIDVAALADLPDGVPSRVALRGRAADAWSSDGGARAAIFLLRRGDEVRAFDTTCPHTGCAVQWDETQRSFRCPCHRSVFAVDGARVSGPAPRGLDPEEIDVQEGRVRVRYRRYRAGRSDRVPT